MHPPTSPDPICVSVLHLLNRALALPCSTAAQAFSQLIQPTMRFQVALDALLPLLEAVPRGTVVIHGFGADQSKNAPESRNSSAIQAELPQRILVSYILFSLYASYPITINPFKSALFMTFTKERAIAQASANVQDPAPYVNEQLVWVLWKILKGDGSDLAPYSPNTLAHSPLPRELKASHLILAESDFLYDSDDYYSTISTTITDTDAKPAPRSANGNSTNTQHIIASRSGSSVAVIPSPSQTPPVPASASSTATMAPNTSLTEGNHRQKQETSKLTAPKTYLFNEQIAKGMALLLAAKERVLTLQEQRVLTSLLPALVLPSDHKHFDGPADTACSTSGSRGMMITSLDLAPLIAHNPMLAHPLIVALLSSERPPSSPTVRMSPNIHNNGSLPLSVSRDAPSSPAALSPSSSYLSPSSSSASFTTAQSGLSTSNSPVPEPLAQCPDFLPQPVVLELHDHSAIVDSVSALSITRFLDVLPTLPPTLATFDLMGRLLRDSTMIRVPNDLTVDFNTHKSVSDEDGTYNGSMTNGNASHGHGGISGGSMSSEQQMTVADLIRTEYLGSFIHSCIEYIDRAEQEEREGQTSEDKWGVGVRNLCRFYQSLIKLSLVDPSSDADSAEMAHFSLRNAKFEEAMALYRVLANAKSGVL